MIFLLKSIKSNLSFITAYESEIRFTTLCSAMGITFKNLNFRIATAKHKTEKVKNKGVTEYENFTILDEYIIFTINGKAALTIIRIDCPEKMPELLLENRSK